MRLTGGEIIVEYLIKEGVPYLVGIPGHGNVALFDAIVDRRDRIRPFPVVHEQSAAHIADAYYRVSGRPLAITTSIGPGAANTTCGVAQAYVDSTAMLVITGSTHTYMRGHSVLQEIDRTHWSNFPRVLEPVVKRWWDVTRVGQLPFVMHSAFNEMLSGRRGPVLIDLPMDVQAEAADVELPEPAERRALRMPAGHPADLERAAALLVQAKRPVMVVGGGAAYSPTAASDVRRIAEHLGAAVITTWHGKGILPQDHELNAWHAGSIGTLCANRLANQADVVLAVGTRFVDWLTGSYTSDVWRIPPAKLIHIDLDPREIGKNYPVEVGILADAGTALAQLVDAVASAGPARAYRATEWFATIRKARQDYLDAFADIRESDRFPMSISRALAEMRKVAPRDSIWVSGAGNPQTQIHQELPFYEPRTHITSGGFSTMGFTVPGAIGAQLAAGDRRVIGVSGDGDFMASLHEIAIAVQQQLPIVYVVMNNAAWQSIENLQVSVYGEARKMNTRFLTPGGANYSPDFVRVAEGFGARASKVTSPDQMGRALQEALDSGRTSVIEVPCAKELPYSGIKKYAWWDVPVPAYLEEARKAYEEARAGERL
ncbi:MAG: thiamine pyrophosphate-binding protein [Acidobacteria bacterium]|nr:thiamine pyrophosphate-binding protein [Acidobacteriota bacterium]